MIAIKREYLTVIQEDQRSIDGINDPDEIIGVLSKNDFAEVRKAIIHTIWLMKIPTASQLSFTYFAGSPYIYGVLSVHVTDFNGRRSQIYNRTGATREDAFAVHQDIVQHYHAWTIMPTKEYSAPIPGERQ